MSYFFDVVIIFTLFLLFAVSHSILAAINFKKRIIEKIGNKIAFYRLFYNLSSLLVFYVIYEISPKPDIILYDLPFPYDIVIFVFQIFSFIGIIWAGSFIDLREFLGISQIKRYLNGNYELDDYDEHQSLVFEGPFKFSRHPIYFFSILFLGLRPAMDLFYFVFFISMTVYFFSGSFYEEKKLVKRFGVRYIEYQKAVPRIIPFLFFKKKSEEEKL